MPRLGVLSTLVAGAAFVACLVAWESGGGSVDLPWAPTLGLRLTFELDGLGALYSLLATGIGTLVLAYSTRYLPAHLDHQGRPPSHAPRFYGLILLFMGSMVGLATAQDTIALFVFWDLTAIASYFLIGYDRHEAESRVAALMALLVTGISAVALLIGVLMLASRHGTFALPELIERAEGGAGLTAAGALVIVAGLAKSAQVPLQFWLPRAMTAPTPVSAYLHSAAMVAAGVLLIGRFHPLLAHSRLLLDALLAVGLASIAVGGVLALTRDNLKQLLAYSTISQYGYVVTMLGLGGAAGAVGASFYVLAHAVAKSALFLTAGAVTEATGGERRLSHLGGLARPLPVLALGSGAAAAGLAALPLTLGFFKDELFFAAALERGAWVGAAAVAAAALTFAYIGRFWAGVFLGPRRTQAHAPPAAMVVPVALLGALVVLGGVHPAPFAGLAEAAGTVTLGSPAAASVAYHADLRAENLMALGVYAAGLALLASRAVWLPAAAAVARLGALAGPERAYGAALAALNRLSDAMHDIEVRDLRIRLAAVLLPAGALVVAGVIATPTAGYTAGSVAVEDIPLIVALAVTALAALGATLPRGHLRMALILSTLGFSLAVVYAFFGAPDVALVAVLVETVFALLFLGVFSLLPRAVLRREAAMQQSRGRQRRNALIGVVAGAVAFMVAWAALSRPSPRRTAAAEHLERTREAHASDSVTAILADFRGLDTMVEISVVAVAMIGLATLLRRGRLW